MTSVLEAGFISAEAMQFVFAEAALRALAMALVIGLGLRLLRIHNPHVQLAVWRAVLIGAIALPLVMPFAVLRILPAPAPVVTAPAFTMPLTGPSVGEYVPLDVVSTAAPFDWHVLILPVYALVAAAMLLRLGLGLVLTWRLRHAAYPVRENWTADADVRVSEALHAPVTVGATILIPADYATWSDEQRRAVLTHERAHAVRGDFHFQVLAGIYRAIFWFSPLAWWLHDRLADLAEVASDAEAASALEQRTSYAAILLDFAAKPRRAGLIAVGMARRETVRRRIERILAESALPTRIPRRAQAGIAAAIVPLVLGAAVSFAQAPVTQIPLPPAAPQTPAVLVPPAPPAPATAPAAPAVVPSVPGIEIDIGDIQERAERLAERGADRAQRALGRMAGKELEREERTQRLVQRARERAAERLQRQKAERDRVTNNNNLNPAIRSNVEAKIAKALEKVGAREPLNPVKETRNVGEFNAIALAVGFGDLIVEVGPRASLVLEGDEETLKLIRADVRHGTLVIDRDRTQQGAPPNIGRITARITLPSLKAVSLSGVGRIQLAGLNGGETAIKVSGSGVVEARGRLDKLTLNISGAGTAEMPQLLAENAEVNISGSGNATINSKGVLDVDISGSARVHYVGTPAHLRTSISGWGTVHQL